VPLDIKFKPDLLEAAIAQIGERAIKGMSGKMRQVAIRIRDLARDYAPERTGLLEKSIHYGSKRVNRHGRLAFFVWVDLDAAAGSKGTKELGDYAFIMEEELHPHGRQRGARRYELGPKSVAKAASGKKVGGRFLARAFRDATRGLEQEMAAEVRRVLNGGRDSGVGYERVRDEDDE